MSQADHTPRYRRRTLGIAPNSSHNIYGYYVRCSCGWSLMVNDTKRKAEKEFNKHKASQIAGEGQNG